MNFDLTDAQKVELILSGGPVFKFKTSEDLDSLRQLIDLPLEILEPWFQDFLKLPSQIKNGYQREYMNALVGGAHYIVKVKKMPSGIHLETSAEILVTMTRFAMFGRTQDIIDEAIPLLIEAFQDLNGRIYSYYCPK